MTTRQVTIYLEDEMHDRAKRAAGSLSLSVSQLVENALKVHIGQLAKSGKFSALAQQLEQDEIVRLSQIANGMQP